MSQATMRNLLGLSVLVLLVMLSGCAGEVAPEPPRGGEGQYPGDNEQPAEDRKIVKEGSITLEVEDLTQSMDDIAGMADEFDGYVVSSYKHEYGQGIAGHVTIRVPSDRFEEAFARLRQMAVEVPYETTRARDVTEEYVDLEARLSNLLATEAQYLALMEQAENVEEVLMVQREISKVRGEIEQIEGRMQYLEQTSDMSLIEVTLQEAKGLAEPWSASAALKSAVRGLTAFGRGLATVLIWLGVFFWAWVPPLVIWLRRRRGARS